MEPLDNPYFVIDIPQKLMELLGYPDGVRCPFSELFEKERWCGRWNLNNDVLKFSIREHSVFVRKPMEKDHTKYDFYHSEIIESGMCEDYGIDDIKNGCKFVSHTQKLAYKANTWFVSYHLKKYIPLVKSSNKTR